MAGFLREGKRLSQVFAPPRRQWPGTAVLSPHADGVLLVANRRGLAAELEALAFVGRRYPPPHAPDRRLERRSAVGVGKVGESRLVDAEVAAAG